eukprot:g5884.t1
MNEFWHYINKSNWLGGSGSQPHQFVPYYLNGLVPLSYQLPDDRNLATIRDRYVGYILAHQQLSGGSGNESAWLGPDVPRHEDLKQHDPPAQNYWSKYFAIEALQSYAEAVGPANPALARRVVRALVAHHRQFYAQLSQADPPLNASRWGFARHEDGLVGIQWLLDPARGGRWGADYVTGPGAAFLRDLLVLLHRQSDEIMAGVPKEQGGGYTWEAWFESGDPFSPHNDSEPTGTTHLLRHGVDIGQAMKIGALWSRVGNTTGSSHGGHGGHGGHSGHGGSNSGGGGGTDRDFRNPAAALAWAEKYLHMSDGMYFADEVSE